MVAGNAHATTPSQNPDLGEEIYWGCSDNSVGGKPTAPPACASGIVSLHVGFPNCWDGVLTHVDDTAHLRHPVGYRCPAGFSHALPRLILRTEYPVGHGGRITLSSGPTFTAHGDFWNTWDQEKLAALVDRCLNAGRDCGVFRGSGSAAGVPVTKPPASAPARPAPPPPRPRPRPLARRWTRPRRTGTVAGRSTRTGRWWRRPPRPAGPPR